MPISGPGRDEHASWLRLAFTPGVGPVTAKALIEKFGHPRRIFAAGPEPLAQLTSPAIASALLADDPVRDATVAATLAWAEAPDHHLLLLPAGGAPARAAPYPARLQEITDPPVVLHLRGHLQWLTRPAIAIVGSRNATTDGCETAFGFARALGEAGFVVVSGLALGIDAAAHRGALGTRGGTVAIVGHGIDRVYPRDHMPLMNAIARSGAVVAELPLGTAPNRGTFPRRNRVIAGLSQAVLVVEAARDSGALITARMALDRGREVLVIPGSIHSPLSKGCHELIREGATLVESASEVIDQVIRSLEEPALQALAVQPTPAAASAGPPPSRRDTRSAAPPSRQPADQQLAIFQDDPDACDTQVLTALGWSPVDIDTLLDRLGPPVGAQLARLMRLELEGRIERLVDGRIRRRGHATRN